MPPLRLEVFETKSDEGAATLVTDLNAMEEARLAAYEQGYAAGWEDAVAAQDSERNQMAADLAHNLQSLNFTYHEARSHVLKGLEPLLMDMVGRLLPEVACAVLAPIVQESLLPMAEKAADTPIQLLFNPAARDVIEPLINHENAPPLVLVEEPTLGEGQVFLRLGDCETRVDLDGVIAEIKDALSDFFTLSTKDQNHG
ncbi:flagellar biosynthesis protein [Pseudorhodobacter turbinis]|uniref:Flagellar biosynthesis protein n=1 Tax=Pseudorhodobacter turbinis TaxID=2500533 RepID=A0A4P8EG05_9RHOB|nr:flagellar biosynthesis protein [Pseudorhodobacter turbinis]QCO55719.1 flagellar biosynthesis protein [Pseudorhodobacter turbinis]